MRKIEARQRRHVKLFADGAEQLPRRKRIERGLPIVLFREGDRFGTLFHLPFIAVHDIGARAEFRGGRQTLQHFPRIGGHAAAARFDGLQGRVVIRFRHAAEMHHPERRGERRERDFVLRQFVASFVRHQQKRIIGRLAAQRHKPFQYFLKLHRAVKDEFIRIEGHIAEIFHPAAQFRLRVNQIEVNRVRR